MQEQDAMVTAVANQFRAAILLHKKRHPYYGTLRAFDSSSNHGLYADDALRVTRMGMKPGGEQSIMRPGYFKNPLTQRLVIGRTELLKA